MSSSPARAASVLFALLCAACALWMAPSAARACSCMRPPPPLAAAEEADVVFEGRASAPTTEGMRLRTSFEVIRTFKGDVGPRVEVLTMASSAACGRRYVPGETYLVYAFMGNGGLGDNLCSRTRRSSEATLDFSALGSGVAPTDIPANADAPNLEPPRIEPAAVEPPPAAPGRRGCAVSAAGVAGLPHAAPGPVWAVLFLLGVASLRRRAYRDAGRPSPQEVPCRSDCSKPRRPSTNPSSPTSQARPLAPRSKPN